MPRRGGREGTAWSGRQGSCGPYDKFFSGSSRSGKEPQPFRTPRSSGPRFGGSLSAPLRGGRPCAPTSGPRYLIPPPGGRFRRSTPPPHGRAGGRGGMAAYFFSGSWAPFFRDSSKVRSSSSSLILRSCWRDSAGPRPRRTIRGVMKIRRLSLLIWSCRCLKR
jgi:hypothetical protein